MSNVFLVQSKELLLLEAGTFVANASAQFWNLLPRLFPLWCFLRTTLREVGFSLVWDRRNQLLAAYLPTFKWA